MVQRLFTGIAIILIIMLTGLLLIRNIIFPLRDMGSKEYVNNYKVENSIEYKIY
ncbi:hypothetical protein [Dethiothermospora halolimnae]|uniref:hypothetical protein n=1 Tax=Dethiothermospora halolimnae TaxID=3114390 RepID=UPI003CCC1E6B